MAINAVFPTHASPVHQSSVSVSPEQSKLAASSGEKTQTESAVPQTDEAESTPENGGTAEKREGRGQLVDIKV